MVVSRYNEEIYFEEYIKIIFKRRVVVLSITFAILVLAGIVNFSMPKIYEVSAIVQNGYLNAPIVSYAETVALLRSRNFSKPIFEKFGINFPEGEKAFKKVLVIENIKDTNYFTIKIKYKNKDVAFSLSQELIKVYVNYGKSLYDNRTILIKNGIVNLDSLIEKTKLSMKNMKDGTSQKDFSFPHSIPDDKVQLRDLLSEKLQLESQLTASKEFKVIDEPSKPVEPISPNVLRNLIVSFVFGLMMGVFYVVLTENWRKFNSKV